MIRLFQNFCNFYSEVLIINIFKEPDFIMKKSLCIFFILFFIVSTVNATVDTLYCIKEQTFKGLIIKSTESKIWIEDNRATYKIPKKVILEILFSRADIVTLENNDSLRCKVLNKNDNRIDIIKEDGTFSIPDKQIKTIQYNKSELLLVDSLPATGDIFENKLAAKIYSYNFKNSIYVRFSPGYHLCQSRYRLTVIDHKVNTVEGFKYAGEMGYTFTDKIRAGIGVEAFLSGKESFSNKVENSFSYSFIYLSTKFIYRPLNMSVISQFVCLDAGFLNATEELYFPLDRRIKANELGSAARIKIGSSVQFNNVEASISLGYLISNMYLFEYTDPEIEALPFYFDGLSFNIELNILINVQDFEPETRKRN